MPGRNVGSDCEEGQTGGIWRFRLHRAWEYFARRCWRIVATGATGHRVRHWRGGGVARLDAVIVINLASRTDRLAGFTAEIRRLGIERVVRFDAIRHENGNIGCTRSHAACARMMIDRGWEAVMVCEDDARFIADRPELDVLVNAFLDDPVAEVACLAYRHLFSERHNPLFLRTRQTVTAACYLVKASIVGDLLAAWEEGIEQMERGGDRMRFNVDTAWLPLQYERVFVIPARRVAIQATSYSDIEMRVVSYGT